MSSPQDEIRAALDEVDTGYARLRAACSDAVGNAFRVEVAERLETQCRINRGLMYRYVGEVTDPPDGPEDPDLPAGTVMSKLLWQRLRITPGEVKRRARVAARIRPRRTLTGGPPLPAELPHLAAAVDAGDVPLLPPRLAAGQQSAAVDTDEEGHREPQTTTPRRNTMTDTDDANEDELRELARALFNPANTPPDVVRGSGLIREDLLRQNANVGTFAEVTIPGDEIPDADGIPNGFGPPTTRVVYRGPSIVTRNQLSEVGLTPEDVPNLIVVDDPPERQQEP